MPCLRSSSSKPKQRGLEIKNNTPFPVQVYVGYFSPLHFEIVQPGECFRRRAATGWLKINAETYFEGVTDKISRRHVIIPIAFVVLTFCTGGTAALVRFAIRCCVAQARRRGIRCMKTRLISGKRSMRGIDPEATHLLVPANLKARYIKRFGAPNCAKKPRAVYEICGGLEKNGGKIDGASPLVIRMLPTEA